MYKTVHTIYEDANTKKIPLSGISENGQHITGYCELQYNDHCENGHNTFTLTGSFWEKDRPKIDKYVFAMGSCHDTILTLAKNTELFDFLKKAVKFHCVTADGPLHYIGNTMYHASDKDYNGYRKGEACAWKECIVFENFPFHMSGKIMNFKTFLQTNSMEALDIKAVPHKKDTNYNYPDNYCFSQMEEETALKWHDCPFDSLRAAEEWKEALQNHAWKIVKVPSRFSEGKERDIETARRCAIWPDATLEQLESREALEAHKIEIMEEFHDFIVNDCGFIY